MHPNTQLMNNMSEKLICKNRQAYFKYSIIETYEAGVVLVGSEVKSIRAGNVNLKDTYATIKGNEAWLINCHISEYESANQFNHKPRRDRKLLLHKSEIIKLLSNLKEKGLTLVPTKMYFKNGKVKMELGLAKGKKLFDKRRDIKEKEEKRSLDKFRKVKNRS